MANAKVATDIPRPTIGSVYCTTIGGASTLVEVIAAKRKGEAVNWSDRTEEAYKVRPVGATSRKYYVRVARQLQNVSLNEKVSRT